MDTVLLTAVATLMILGLLELAAAVRRLWWGKGKLRSCCLVVWVDNAEEAEEQLRRARDSLRWAGWGTPCRVAVVSCCPDGESWEICWRLCRDWGWQLCTDIPAAKEP